MPADNLDTNMGLVTDSKGNELLATPYFENYLYNLVATMGGEGSTIISDIVNTVIAADKLDPLLSLVKSLKRQVDEINNTVDSPILDAKVKTMQTKLSELEAHFDHARLDATIKQIQIDTAGFIGMVQTSNYTAENKDWVEARNKITVKLPANPLVNDQVIVSNGDGSLITINGNGNNIKYTRTDASAQIANQGTSLHFQLFEDQSTKYWRIR